MTDVVVRFLAEAIGAVKGLIFLALIARTFGQVGYGVWTQISLTAVLLQPLITLQLGAAVVRYLTEIPAGKERRDAVYSVNWIVWLSGAVLMVLAWSLRGSFSSALFGSGSFDAYVMPLALLMASQASLTTAISYYRAVGELKRSAMIQAGTSVGSIAIVVIAVLAFRATLHEAVIAWAASIALGASLSQLTIALREGVSIKIRPDIVRRFLRYSLPLVPAIGAAWIIEYSDRYVIVHMLGLADAGIYTGSYRLAQVMRMMMSPVVFVLLPTILRLRKEGKPLKAQSLMRSAHAAYLVIGGCIAALLIALGPRFLFLLGAEGFRVSQSLLALLVLGEMLLALRLLDTQVLYLAERTPTVLIIIASTAVMNVILNVLLIPSLGILGAAIATFASYAAQWFAMKLAVRNENRSAIPMDVFVRVALGSGLLYGILRLASRRGIAGLSLGIVGGMLVYAGLLWSSPSIRAALYNLIRQREVS